jgi:hypothetical protein
MKPDIIIEIYLKKTEEGGINNGYPDVKQTLVNPSEFDYSKGVPYGN